jgi:16S rRNA (cytosine967-C5)-methyltransferase
LLPVVESGIIVETPVVVEKLPGFAAGEVCVQDGAAQLAAELLTFMPGDVVLDACAAPGGKLTHLLEREPRLKVVAVEKEATRLVAIHDNLQRLHLQATCYCADVGEADKWWDGRLFNGILLDVPCSASGVVRRHPDIKLLRQPEDLPALAKEQARLLKALWPLLKPEGVLLYVTCSIFPIENEQVVSAFLAQHTDAQEEKIEADWGLPCLVGRQILPGMHDMDGFYFAKLRKRPVVV